MSSSIFKFKYSSKWDPYLKKIYFFYNIYIRNYKSFFNSSQFKEDTEVLKYFTKNYKGIYLDIGAFHPVKVSNTFKMYKSGWKGINIDMNSLSIEMFNYARPNDINICAAISSKESYKTMYFHHDLSPLSTIEKNHVKFLKKHFKIRNLRKKKIKTKNINKILKKYNLKKIDFLNIDIEGHEFEVLKTINFKKVKIEVICVEMLNHNLVSKNKSRLLLKLLKEKKYKLYFTTPTNYIFTKI